MVNSNGFRIGTMLAVLTLGFALGAAASAQDRVYAPDGVALDGYDPVAYFTHGVAREGSKDHALTWNGVDWHFSSAEHRRLFEQNPEKYMPRYGGFDAFMMAQDTLMRTDAEDFLVAGGQLYLFSNKALKRKFADDLRRKTAYADHYWKGQ
ncbi:hypothetical protein CCR85_04210 [Rhodothalassium salexigens]|uniref:YHS domain-containing (seleno)protein n=1 Tax=Rhodothalassium salexigens TaxID=1086 RepID=UPI00191146FD|nr:YHS domain-containing (seleno)protein [Rhodothalassium salexigens]MBK5910695.1 hypothetical protein [Rhodothalassium salexigens]MBK5920065.1 hypothetical protein [Rhodothalassium salexigens]